MNIVDYKYDITALGEVLIDFTNLDKNEVGYPILSAYPGGAPTNLLAVNAKMGLKTNLIGQVGDDPFGNMLIDSLKSLSIETENIVKDKNSFTTLAFVTLDEKGDRTFSFSRKPGADTRLILSEGQKLSIKSSRLFHFGSLSLTDEPARTSTIEAVNFAREENLMISFDPNLREDLWKSLDEAKEEIIWGLGKADIVKLSLEEAEFLYGKDLEAIVKNLRELKNLKIGVITLGKDGCIAFNYDYCIRVEGERAKTLDTTGAGDIFTGSFIYKLLDGDFDFSEDYVRKALIFSNKVAAKSTEKMGGLTSIPKRDFLFSLMKD